MRKEKKDPIREYGQVLANQLYIISEMSLKRIIDVPTLAELLKKNVINKEGVRLLDCSYAVGTKPDWKKFKADLYGNFKEILAQPSLSKKMYLLGHLPEAAFMSFDAALYPSQYERFALYPAELFEKYIQMIGVNQGEHIILYSRGAIGGMMFSSKAAWLFKSYGHSPDKISILNGGLERWVRLGHELSKEEVLLPTGNWRASDQIEKHNIKFEELENKDGDKAYIERTEEVNFLDARVRQQFEGTEETGLDAHRVKGSHIPGFKNAPAVDLINENGELKSFEDIREWFTQKGYKPNHPVVTICNTGMQASMLAHIMEIAVPETSPRVYNGSMKEMEARDPKRIVAGKSQVP
ncbi:unnamed protein product [Cylicocyclus nassatus]|uniref:Rhodanese domain-containing protein n=1 Tax=Cylicocyclus nassatus TaxID=53992 RepID=A0AA36GGE8_CYLNA|nr:unnamed protein product [Cylicocyclus nassatus]